jgi:predicted Zn-dependent protease
MGSQQQAPEAVLTEADARALGQRLLGFVTADEASVRVVASDHGHTRFANRQVTASGGTVDVGFDITVRSGARAAAVRVNGLVDATAQAAVRRAESMVAVMPDDPEAMPLLGPQTYVRPEADAAETAALDAAARAAAAEDVMAEAESAGMEGAGVLERVVRAEAVINSAGLFAYHRSTQAAWTGTVRTADGMGSGWAGATHNAWSRMPSPAEVGRRAAQAAARSAGAADIEPGRYTVVVAPTAAGSLLRLVHDAFDARAAAEGRSPFSGPDGATRIGEQIAHPALTMVSDPEDPDLLETPFTADGQPLGRTTWVRDGVLQTLAADRYWASRHGFDPVPVGGGLRVEGGTETAEEMVAGIERGIFVTRLWYIRQVDPRTLQYTGLTRDGTFLIRQGRVAGPVKNLRFNQSLLAMLGDVQRVGAAERVVASESGGVGPATVAPPLVVRDFHFTSLSDAV